MSAGCGPVFRVFKVAQRVKKELFFSRFSSQKKPKQTKEREEEKTMMMTHPNYA
jgi:hypothetical protein